MTNEQIKALKDFIPFYRIVQAQTELCEISFDEVVSLYITLQEVQATFYRHRSPILVNVGVFLKAFLVRLQSNDFLRIAITLNLDGYKDDKLVDVVAAYKDLRTKWNSVLVNEPFMRVHIARCFGVRNVATFCIFMED